MNAEKAGSEGAGAGAACLTFSDPKLTAYIALRSFYALLQLPSILCKMQLHTHFQFFKSQFHNRKLSLS